MDNSSPFSDHKCINSNITITGDGGGPTPTDYNLPWFDPCIGPKRKVLPPPYPEQTTPIPSAKVTAVVFILLCAVIFVCMG